MPKQFIFYCIFFFSMLIFCSTTRAQQRKDTLIFHSDTTAKISNKNLLSQDTSARKFNPRIATRRSAILPGWGQAYNHKYWKIPLIYGALGVTAGIFVYDLNLYKALRKAYTIRITGDSSQFSQIDPRFVPLSTESIRTYRNQFRQDLDYSVLVFLVFWGLNVVDATVDAHLKGFNVNDNLSLKFKPRFDPITKTAGLALIMTFKDTHSPNPNFAR